MWYVHIFEGLIFDKDTLFYVLSTYFAKIVQCPTYWYTLLFSWITNQKDHDHGALPNHLGYTLSSLKYELKFSFLLKNMFKLFWHNLFQTYFSRASPYHNWKILFATYAQQV
jgi:hypothetical protein